jgi:hypothetical protein
MIDTTELAFIVSAHDDRMDVAEGEQSPLPALFTELGIEPTAAFHVAEQRALRVLAISQGKDPAKLRGSDLSPEAKQFMSYMGASFLDGLAAGKRLGGAPPVKVCPDCGESPAERGHDEDGDPCTHPCHDEAAS